MERNDRIYKVVSIVSTGLHVALFVFLLVCSFPPFHEGRSFYQEFSGYFGSFFSMSHPILLLALPLAAAVFAFFSIKQPLFSLGIVVFSMAFFILIVMPYTIEAMIIGISSPWIGSTMSTYQNGCWFMFRASYILYFEWAFALYALGTTVARRCKKAV